MRYSEQHSKSVTEFVPSRDVGIVSGPPDSRSTTHQNPRSGVDREQRSNVASEEPATAKDIEVIATTARVMTGVCLQSVTQIRQSFEPEPASQMKTIPQYPSLLFGNIGSGSGSGTTECVAVSVVEFQ